MSFSIDESVLMNCLKADGGDEHSVITVKNYAQTTQHFAPGVSNCSGLIKVRVEYARDGEPKEKTFLAKVPSLSASYIYCKPAGYYKREAYVYETLILKMTELLDSPVTPLHYQTVNSENLILEDLTGSGFAPQPNGLLSLEHSAIALETLAKFHAASYKVHQQNPALFYQISQELMFCDDGIRLGIKPSVPAVVAVLRAAGISSGTAGKLLSFPEEYSEQSAFSPANGTLRFYVLNHGDFKSNNILFKTNREGKPISAKFVDFQVSRWHSPVTDIIFFVVSSMKCHVFKEHAHDLLETYLRSLNTTLDRVGCEAKYKTIQNVYEEMETLNVYRILILLYFLIVKVRVVLKDFNWGEKIVLQPDDIQKVCEDETFKQYFQWVKYYEEQGIFEK